MKGKTKKEGLRRDNADFLSRYILRPEMMVSQKYTRVNRPFKYGLCCRKEKRFFCCAGVKGSVYPMSSHPGREGPKTQL